MKKLITIFSAFIVLMLTYIACDDNEYINPYDFPFSVTLNSESKGYTGIPIDITSEFEAKYNTANVEHSYIMTSNIDGFLIDSMGNQIKSDTWVKYKLNQKFMYQPNVKGEHQLNFKFKNKWGFEVIQQRKITIENSQFQFTSSVTSNNASIGVPKEITLNLQKGDNQPKDTKYTYSFTLDGISGELKDGTNVLEQNKTIDISVGERKLNFIADNMTDEKGG